MKIRIIVLSLIFPLLAGCSILFNRTTQKVYVTTPGVNGAYCTMETDKQRYQVLTPGFVRTERSGYDMIVTCSKNGYTTANMTVKSKAFIKPIWTSMEHYTPGFSPETVTRTVYSYPENISLDLSPKE